MTLLDDRMLIVFRFQFAYILAFILGIGVLFPWNAFITVTQYFDSRVENSKFSVCKLFRAVDVKGNFENYITFTFQATSLTCLGIATKYRHHFSVVSRVKWSLVACFIVFAVTTALVKV
jgi:equilibrative nucleoside transporter 1/2/3